MNNITKCISILLLIFNSLDLSAQNQKELLAGTWNFDFQNSVANMEQSAKTVLAKNPSAMAKLESTYRNRQILFIADGNYIFQLSNGKQDRGTWSGTNTNRAITITNSQGFVQNFTIVLISPTALILQPEADGKMRPMFSKWYFTKN